MPFGYNHVRIPIKFGFRNIVDGTDSAATDHRNNEVRGMNMDHRAEERFRMQEMEY